MYHFHGLCTGKTVLNAKFTASGARGVEPKKGGFGEIRPVCWKFGTCILLTHTHTITYTAWSCRMLTSTPFCLPCDGDSVWQPKSTYRKLEFVSALKMSVETELVRNGVLATDSWWSNIPLNSVRATYCAIYVPIEWSSQGHFASREAEQDMHGERGSQNVIRPHAFVLSHFNAKEINWSGAQSAVWR